MLRRRFFFSLCFFCFLPFRGLFVCCFWPPRPSPLLGPALFSGSAWPRPGGRGGAGWGGCRGQGRQKKPKTFRPPRKTFWLASFSGCWAPGPSPLFGPTPLTRRRFLPGVSPRRCLFRLWPCTRARAQRQPQTDRQTVGQASAARRSETRRLAACAKRQAGPRHPGAPVGEEATGKQGLLRELNLGPLAP